MLSQTIVAHANMAQLTILDAQNPQGKAPAVVAKRAPVKRVITIVDEAIKSGRQVCLENLSFTSVEKDITDFFVTGSFSIEAVEVPVRKKKPRRTYGRAYVTLTTASEAERAISELNGKFMLEREVHMRLTALNEQKQKKNPLPPPSSVAEADEFNDEAATLSEAETEDEDEALAQVDPNDQSVGGVLTRHIRTLFNRPLDFTKLNSFVRQGKALLLFIVWPSRSQMKKKGMIERSDLRTAFYSSILGSNLDGLYAVKEVHKPNPKESLKILLIFGSSRSADITADLLSTASVTIERHRIEVQVVKYPELNLSDLVHEKSYYAAKTIGDVLSWNSPTAKLMKIWENSIAASAISRISAGEIPLEAYLEQNQRK